jgi:hypothetical protein
VKTLPRLSRSLVVVLAACGGSAPFQVSSDSSGGLTVTGTPGSTPFISMLQLTGSSLATLGSVSYTVQPRSGSASKPVSVRYSQAALQRGGWITETGVTVPVFGLYAGSDNQVALEVQGTDGSRQDVAVKITTQPYEDTDGIYDHPTVLQPRAVGSSLGFDFFALKSTRASVLVVDTDGQVRWIGTGTPSGSTIFTDNGFVVGDPASPAMERLELDGAVTAGRVTDSTVTDFTHNIDPGKAGLLAEFDVQGELDASLADISPSGQVLAGWKLGVLLSAYMSQAGDDPTKFVRPGVDWFHLNAATYDASDDSIIVSSRENFVIKIDYATGTPIWILGDPTKYWYTFPSLRAKALTLAPGGAYPIGQHATSITSDGLLMLFNDGTASVNQPAGTPVGQTLPSSLISAYRIDPVAMTATEVWRFDHQPEITSQYCGSAYEAGQSFLIDYALASAGSTTRILGLDSNRQPVFDIAYGTSGCQTAWNAIPIPFDSLQFD